MQLSTSLAPPTDRQVKEKRRKFETALHISAVAAGAATTFLQKKYDGNREIIINNGSPITGKSSSSK